MSQSPSFLSKIYYGVPRFVGEVFRATKIPSLIILIGVFAIPVLLGLTLSIAAMVSHSSVPLALLPIGILQFQSPEIQAQAGPEMLNLLHTMTPNELAWSRHLAEFLMVDSVLSAIAVFWWLFIFLRFLAGRSRRNH